MQKVSAAILLAALWCGGLSAQALSGAYTINNSQPATSTNFTDFGAAFDALEANGVAGPCIFTVYAGNGPYASGNNYGLGVNGTSPQPVSGLSATNTLAFIAAGGEQPTVTGNGVPHPQYSGTVQMVIAAPFVTVSGLSFYQSSSAGLVFFRGTGMNCSDINVLKCVFRNITYGPGLILHGLAGVLNNVLVENCVASNCGSGDGGLWQNYYGSICVISAGSNFRLLHNSVLLNVAQSGGGTNMCALSSQFGSGGFAEMSYNILACAVSGFAIMRMDAIPLTAEGNVFHFTSGASFSLGGGIPSSFAAWQAQGRDVTGTLSDPLFASAPADANLHVTTSSPAIGRATASTAGDDFDAHSRPLGPNRESGADEFSGASLPSLNQATPNTGTNSGGTPVTLTGAGLEGFVEVLFDTQFASSIVRVNSTTLTCITPPHAPGAVNVRVRCAGGNSAPAGIYTYVMGAGGPVLSQVTPSAGPNAGGTNVTLTGSQFTGATSVTFNGLAATNLAVVSDTSITCTTPGGGGACSVIVTTPGGQNSPNTAYFYQNQPNVTGVSPSSGNFAGGAVVTVTGSEFQNVSSVTFNGTAATSVRTSPGGGLECVVPAGSVGSCSVLVTTPGGTNPANALFTYNTTPAPTLSSVNPPSGNWFGNTNVTIFGTNFTGVSGVKFDGIHANNVTLVSSTQITCITPNHTAFGTGPVSVHVLTPGGTNPANTAFTYTGGPAPVIYSISPTACLPAGGATLTFTGLYYTGTVDVRIDGVSVAFSVLSDTSLTCVAPAHAVGTVPIVVQNVNSSTFPAYTGFVYQDVPVISNVTPSSGPPSGGNSVSISGANYVGLISVTFNGSPATNLNQSGGTITCTAPPGAVGPASIIITTPCGSNAANSAYTYQLAPSIAQVAPDHGLVTGGTAVTLTGSGFTGATAVKFGGVNAASFSVVSDTTINCTTPGGAAGAAEVLVQTPAGMTPPNSLYTYDPLPPPPSVTAIAPNSGPIAGGTAVTISGSGFTGATLVAIGGVPATSVSVLSDSSISCVTPANSAGVASVAVTTVWGVNPANGLFTYLAPTAPTVTGVAPNSGPPTGGTAVTITGTGFLASSSVAFGASPASGIVVVSPTTITCNSPAHAVGAVTVSVTTTNGTGSLVGAFTYSLPPPTLTGIAPNNGGAAGGTSVTLTGTDLDSVTAVSFGGAVASIVAATASTLTVTTPAHASGAVDVIANAPAGSATLFGGFTYTGGGGTGSGSGDGDEQEGCSTNEAQGTALLLVPLTLLLLSLRRRRAAGLLLFGALLLSACGGGDEGGEGDSGPTALVFQTANLPSGPQGVAYVQPLTASGGTAPYAWSLMGGALPPGISLSPTGTPSAVLTGTPTATGSFGFTVQVQDSAGQSAQRALNLDITSPLALSITTSTLAPAALNSPYSAAVSAMGGSGMGFGWSITAGALPPGLSLSAGGTPAASILGSATGTGTFNFTVQVQDSLAAIATANLSIQVYPPLAITTLSVPDAAPGSPYNAVVGATGGTGAGYVWTLSAGALPPGCSLSSGTPNAVLAGTPSAAGPYNFTLHLEDSAGFSTSRAYALNVVAGASISTSNLLPAAQGVPYSAQIFATSAGGNVWQVIAGALPAGLSLSASGTPSATLSGTAVAAGTFAFTVQVTDGASQTASKALSLVVAAPGTIYTVAGGGASIGDGRQANDCSVYFPNGVCRDATGNIYFVDAGHNRVRRVDAGTGIITTFAGTGVAGYSGDNAAATSARLNGPTDVAMDAGGNLFIADSGNHRVRRVDGSTLQITTCAGTGVSGFSGDAGQATMAKLKFPSSVILDAAGNLYIADTGNERVRKVGTGGVITTIAGTGVAGYNSDGIAAFSALLNEPTELELDTANNLYIADVLNYRVRRIDAGTGLISTYAGNGISVHSGDTGQATSAGINRPTGLAFDSTGNLYVSEYLANRIRKVANTGIITTIAGTGPIATGTGGGAFYGDGGPADVAYLNNPRGLCIWGTNLLIGDSFNHRIRRIDLSSGNLFTFAGGVAPGDGDAATDAILYNPRYLCFDGSGELVISDAGFRFVRRVNFQDGRIRKLAGSGVVGFFGDGGAASEASFANITAVALDTGNHVYVSDYGANRIRRVHASTGLITTVAGDGTAGSAGDGGQATAAQLNQPQVVAFDAAGNMYIAPSNDHRIRKVDVSTGVITTIAGTVAGGYAGDNGPATSAQFSEITDLAFDTSGNLFIADVGNKRVRRIDALTGIITTCAGNGTSGNSGDGGQATSAQIRAPSGLALDGAGNLYISDESSCVIRRVNSSGIISTVAGTGTPGFNGDNIPATSALIDTPTDLVCDAAGNLYLCDYLNDRVRVIVAP